MEQVRAEGIGPSEAERDGWRAGQADKLLGRRSDYAYFGVSLERAGSYVAEYSRGYRRAFTRW